MRRVRSRGPLPRTGLAVAVALRALKERRDTPGGHRGKLQVPRRYTLSTVNRSSHWHKSRFPLAFPDLPSPLRRQMRNAKLETSGDTKRLDKALTGPLTGLGRFVLWDAVKSRPTGLCHAQDREDRPDRRAAFEAKLPPGGQAKGRKASQGTR